MATAGSDIPGPEGYGVPTGFDNLLAGERSEAAIVAGVLAGCNCLSSGPPLIMIAQGPAGDAVAMGAT